jgi:hypothetical protein
MCDTHLQWLGMATTAVMYNPTALCSALLFVGKTTFEQEGMAVYN